MCNIASDFNLRLVNIGEETGSSDDKLSRKDFKQLAIVLYTMSSQLPK